MWKIRLFSLVWAISSTALPMVPFASQYVAGRLPWAAALNAQATGNREKPGQPGVVKMKLVRKLNQG